jgi:surfeit locus 1 family protein
VSRWKFRPSFAVTVAAAVTIAVTVMLGQWQQRRADFKLSIAAQLEEKARQPAIALPDVRADPAELEYRRVRVRGEYLPLMTLLLDNKVVKSVAGYHVITPLKISGSDRYVLVNRGWVAGGPRRDVLPTFDTPTGIIEVEGIALVPSDRFFALGPETSQGPVRQHIVIADVAAQMRLPLQPVLVQQTSDAPDGLVRDWERPDTGVEMHRAYALQWYSFAALAAILYVALNFKRAA